MTVKNLDVHKLSSEEKANLIKKYTSAGWEYNGGWDLSVHKWLSFTWSHDLEPPEI